MDNVFASDLMLVIVLAIEPDLELAQDKVQGLLDGGLLWVQLEETGT